MKIYLVACSGSKWHHPAPARDLYTGDLFRAARAYAEYQGGPWAILSAKHGLVMPDQVLEPYDLRVTQLDRDYRQAWVFRVDAALLSWVHQDLGGEKSLGCHWSLCYGWEPQPTFVLLAGMVYTHTPGVSVFLKDRILNRGWGVELPLAGMGIGQQRQWLRREVREPRLEVPA